MKMRAFSGGYCTVGDGVAGRDVTLALDPLHRASWWSSSRIQRSHWSDLGSIPRKRAKRATEEFTLGAGPKPG